TRHFSMAATCSTPVPCPDEPSPRFPLASHLPDGRQKQTPGEIRAFWMSGIKGTMTISHQNTNKFTINPRVTRVVLILPGAVPSHYRIIHKKGSVAMCMSSSFQVRSSLQQT